MSAGLLLARNDALLPRELDALYPPGLKFLANLSRIAAGPSSRVGRPGERLARSLERLGPVAIKLGQLLSTRADIFGETFALDLARLKDKLDPFPTDQARREGVNDLRRAGLVKVKHGLTSLEEVEACTNE